MHSPACYIDGRAYADIPVLKNEPAFFDDGAPNPRFDWKGFKKMAFQKPMGKETLRSKRANARARDATRERERREAIQYAAEAPEREKVRKRKAKRKAAKRRAFINAVADAVIKRMRHATR
jgi:hypothetical protein